MHRRERVLTSFCVLVVAACGASAPPPQRAANPTHDGDTDGDTVFDIDDACVLEAEDLDGRHDDDGCPDLDDDADGIADVDDLCPCELEDRDGWEDADGCPDLDNDRDHIVDACDLCPNEPEVYNGSCDEDGCPDRSHICVETSSIAIIEYIYFRAGSGAISPASAPILDALAATMQGNPQITLVAVIGQIDPHEPRGSGLALRRAQAVLEALVLRGTPRDRLVAEAGTGAAVLNLAPDRQRRVELSVRALDGVGLDVLPEGTPPPPLEPPCGQRAPCEVPVCAPTVARPVC